MPRPPRQYDPSPPVTASYPSTHLTVSAGLAIFHLATSRVVLCYHTRDKYWFLPKGRKNVNEDITKCAEREAFEESGYKARILGIVMGHRQTFSEQGEERWAKEPIWTQLLPLSRARQYLLFWYVGETVPPSLETVDGPAGVFQEGMTLKERIALDVVVKEDGTQEVYEPVRHDGTGVDEEEALYTSALLPIEEACSKLRGSVMEDVVRRGWEGIQKRMEIENVEEKGKV